MSSNARIIERRVRKRARAKLAVGLALASFGVVVSAPGVAVASQTAYGTGQARAGEFPNTIPAHTASYHTGDEYGIKEAQGPRGPRGPRGPKGAKVPRMRRV
jgi:hypothetical protein